MAAILDNMVDNQLLLFQSLLSLVISPSLMQAFLTTNEIQCLQLFNCTLC